MLLTKEEIDKMDYEQMLREWRFAPIGDPTFAKGEISDYFNKRMQELKEKCDHVEISKRVGW